MWRNYLAVGLRALVKNRTYAAINIAGLGVGMAACLMILHYVRYELSYDTWIPGAEDSYQLQSWYEDRETGETGLLQMAPYISGKRIRKDFPQVEKEVYAFSTQPVFIRDGQPSAAEDFIYVDANFLDVVALPLVSGDRRTLDRPGNALMTESEAKKRFGSTDILGKTFTVISKGVARDFRVGGVLRDLPKNSHLRITTIARLDFAAFMADTPDFLSCWGCTSGWIYLRLKPGTDPRAIEAGLPAWEKRNIPDENAGEAHYNAGDDQDWHLVNIRDVHLGPAQQGAMAPGNDRRTIATFAVIALLILGMAIVNFTNLTTARASHRAREVALRKVLGAKRAQLVVQFVGEATLLASAAMLLAVASTELLLPAFSAFLDADIRLSYLGRDGLILPALALVAAVGVAGGIYPAVFLSRFQPAQVLKANKSSAETPGSSRLRTTLVIVQFAVSIGLIICTAVIYAQTVYARTVDPGYRREGILQVEELNRYQLLDQGERIVDMARKVDGVVAAGRTSIGVATDNKNNTNVMVPGRADPQTIGLYSVDEDMLEAMGMTLVAGRWFERDRLMDDMTLPYPPEPKAERAIANRGGNIVINELAARRLGFHEPAEAVGKTLRAAIVDNEIGLVPVTVIGVVRDARFRSIREPIDPIMFLNGESGHTHMIVRYRGDPDAVRRGVEAGWKTITSEVPFTARFSDDIMRELYEAEDARAMTFAAFAILSVAIGCLGLFGLAAFTAERRTKEIGIRKVLGARTQDIMRLLVWQFSKLVVVANLIAWPVAWWLMRDWLNDFDDRISLNPGIFLGAGALAMVIASATIVSHALKVARSSPIHALRYE